MSFADLSKREQHQVIDYLAFTYLVGHRPARMNCDTNWSTEVICGMDYLSEGKWAVREKYLPVVREHPAVKLATKASLEGFRLVSKSHQTHSTRSPWSIRKGIRMLHDDGREILIHRDGTMYQVQDENRKFCWVTLYKRGKPCENL